MAQVSEETRLQALASLNLLDTPREERFDRLVRLAKKLFEVPTAVVSLVDEDRWWVKAEAGLDGITELPRSESMCTHAVDADAVLVVRDPALDARFRDNRFVTGEGVRFYAGEPLHTPGGAAVGVLCVFDTKPRELSEAQLETLRALADVVETELARTDELARAGELQRNLLPRLKPNLPGYQVAGVCLPASAISGDFYDWQAVGDGFQVVLADVMGKGIPAALIGAGVRSLMRGASRFNDLENAVNRVAYSIEPDLTETSTFVTMLAARLDPHTGILTYVDAGHGIAGIVTHQGKAEQFDSDGLPLGAPAWEPWRAEQVQLEPGDTFVALSDGALDLFETIAEAREAIRETIVSARDPQEVVDVVATYSTDHHATDDVTCVVIKRNEG
jgi:Stage II sporulation protein E (SpoIIE)/GAF domain